MPINLLIPQEKENYCVCSVLQSIFKKYHLNIEQDAIAQNLTPSKKGFYVDDYNFKNFLNKNGFNYDYYFYNEVPFNEPDFLLKEMKKENGFVGFYNHVYLLNDFRDPIVGLIDPSNNLLLEKELTNLLMDMSRGSGFFGLIKKLNQH